MISGLDFDDLYAFSLGSVWLFINGLTHFIVLFVILIVDSSRTTVFRLNGWDRRSCDFFHGIIRL